MSDKSHQQGLKMDGPSGPGSRQGGSQQGGSRHGGSQHGGTQHGGSQHGGSQHGGSQHGGSQHGGSPKRSGSSPFPEGLGYDPAVQSGPLGEEDLDDMHRASLPTRIDLPPEAYIRCLKESPFPLRPAYNSSGKDVMLKVNQFRMETADCPDIWQYDVTIANLSPNFPKCDVILRKCWDTPSVQSRLKKMEFKWFFDGKKLAWSRNNCAGSLRLELNLDTEYGRPARPNSPNVFTFVMRQTTKIRLGALKAYMEGKSSWSNHVLECLNFFDHAMRQFPSENLLAIKRNFYDQSRGKLEMLDLVVGAAKGIYSSFRLCESINSGQSGLGVNVDVANTTFWASGNLDLIMRNYLCSSKEWANLSMKELTDALAPVQFRNKAGNLDWVPSPAFQGLRKLMKLRFEVRYRGKMQSRKIYTIKRFVFDPKYGQDGATSEQVTFTVKRTGETRSVKEHFHKTYNVRLQNERLPLVETTRDGMFPPEVCVILPWQRYNFKLDGAQTSKMIKFAVTRPQERARRIMENVQKLRWNDDPYLKELGIKINPNMTAVKAKLMPNPEVQYGNGKVNPGTTGRWDLRGRTFLVPNQVPLRSWGFVVSGACVDQPTLQNFIKVFKDTYKKHGGRIDGEHQVMGCPRGMDPATCTQNAYQTFGKKAGSSPTIIFVVLPSKDVTPYLRFKKNMECRYGIVSQMMNVDHVRKASPQYCSNVCMKVNCKLGGQVSRVASANKNASPFFTKPTMMIGMDVSHGEPSMAAMTFSMDRDAARYAAACQTNGFGREIMNPLSIRTMFPRILKKWRETMGTSPVHVFYFRDGVDEGQFARVLDDELAAIREVFKESKCNKPAITVIVATKRHHIRFFPDQKAGDKNGNPLPGTLVEREVTHPFYYDFYLCSHVAIQGTARPVHYHVIHDEVKMKPDDLQKMIYQQCYQYQRATTPVSLHPAVYYAHLAADRARAHENVSSSQRDPKMQQPKGWLHKDTRGGGGRDEPTESVPLLDFGSKEADPRNVQHTIYTMWYI